MIILPHTADDLMADWNYPLDREIRHAFLGECDPNTILDGDLGTGDPRGDQWGGMFNMTFFDDVDLGELQLGNTFDSLFAQTNPEWHNQSHWTNDDPEETLSKVLIQDIMWSANKNCPAESIRNSSFDTASTSGLGQTSQQSLLRPHWRNAGVPVFNMITPHTPPMSDSDGEDAKTDNSKAFPLGSILPETLVDPNLVDPRFDILPNKEPEAKRSMPGPSCAAGPSSMASATLADRVEELDEDDEDDTSESESDSEEDKTYRPPPQRVTHNSSSLRSIMRATENDHSYFISDRSASMGMSDLGIDTPSDSEEEIDVVSYADEVDPAVSDKKYPVGTRLGYIPPTNPPNGQRRIAKKALEPASSNNRNGLKVMLPTKRSLSPTYYPPAKRKAAPARATNKGRKPRQRRAKRKCSNYSNDSGSENDFPPREKRTQHNDMERKRRIDLKKSFETLRRCIPALEKNEKAAKVNILGEAAIYCVQLMDKAKELEVKEQEINKKQMDLVRKVSALRRECASLAGVRENNFVLDY